MLSLLDHYADMEAGLRALLFRLVDGFNPSEVAEVDEFIEAREYGLALETLAAVLVDESKEFDGSVVETIQELARAMNMEDSEIIKGIVAGHQQQRGMAM